MTVDASKQDFNEAADPAPADTAPTHSAAHHGTLITRRLFVAYTAAALLASAGLSGCASSEPRYSVASSLSSDELLEASDRSASPEDIGPPRHLARLAVIGDTHVTASFEPGVMHTRAAFQAITQFDPQPDAIIINGDITDHGLEEEYDLVTQLAAEAGLQFPGSFVPVMGNHEQRGGFTEFSPEVYQLQRDLFLRRCQLNRLYYDTEVGGQHLIALGPDADPENWWTFRLSAEQLSWLDDLLARDAEQSRRSFVFLHQPARDTVLYTHEDELAQYALESSEGLLAVVNKYRDVILLTGHSHSPNDFQRPDPAGPLFVANSAIAYLRTDAHDSTVGDTTMSRGLIIDVFTDRTEFTAWDYAIGDTADTGTYTLSREF